MYLNAEDLRVLSDIVKRMDSLGSAFNGCLSFTNSAGNTVDLDYRAGASEGVTRHALHFPVTN